MTDRELMQQALEALNHVNVQDRVQIIAALRERLARQELECDGKCCVRVPARQEHEPVAWADMDVRGEDKGLSWTPGYFHKTPIYTAPQPAQQPAQQPLTDEQIIGLWQYTKEPDGHRIERFARAIEAAHGITGEKK